MVKGASIKYIMEFVTKKRGVEGLNKLIEKSNENGILFTSERDIDPSKNYPARYFIRVLNASLSVLKDEELIEEMGKYFAEQINPNFRGLTGVYPPKKSMQTMVIYLRDTLPVFHSGYRTITENTYWLGVSKINRTIVPFVDGFVKSMIEAHGHVADVKKSVKESKIEYILKF